MSDETGEAGDVEQFTVPTAEAVAKEIEATTAQIHALKLMRKLVEEAAPLDMETGVLAGLPDDAEIVKESERKTVHLRNLRRQLRSSELFHGKKGG
jgi:hypothetical protein